MLYIVTALDPGRSNWIDRKFYQDADYQPVWVESGELVQGVFLPHLKEQKNENLIAK
jgi:hypothetical protein